MPSMITKILVRNVGVLKAFDTPNAPRLTKLTTVYARNGRGKTTLSHILRAASSGNSSILKGRRTLGESAEPQVTLVMDGGNVTYASGQWNQREAPIEVFDAAFIADNLYAGEAVDLEHDRGLFTIVLGQHGVKLVKQQIFFNAVAKRTGAVLKEAENTLRDDIPEGLSREEFLGLLPAADLDDQIVQAQKGLKAVQQSDRLARLQKFQAISIPALRNPTAILAQTVPDIDPAARERLAAHFAKFKLGRQGEPWVRFGQEHVHDDNCPFCGKAGVDDDGLLTLYGQIFSEAYQRHLDAIKLGSDDLLQSLGPERQGQLSSQIAANAEAVRGWNEFYNLSSVTLPDLNEALADLSSAFANCSALFEAKRQSPLTPVAADAAVAEAQGSVVRASAAFEEYNGALAAMERLIQSQRAATPSTENQAKQRLDSLNKRKRRTDAGVQRRIDHLFRAKRSDDRAKRVRTLVQTRLKAASKNAAEHYYEKVNEYLQAFGASFRISKISDSMTGNIGSVDYGLVVRGHAVGRGRRGANDEEPTFKNTLSTGDKTTLAFAFFLSSLDRRTSISDKVVVFDDPLSSHDTHRQGKTVDLLSKLCGKAAQIIVLSHDAHFLRRVSKRCAGVDQTCYEIQFDGDNWSKAAAADLDELCQSEDGRQVNQLLAYYNQRTGQPADVAPAVRKVLESHYRRAYRAYFGPTDNLGPIITKIRTAGSTHPCWNDLGELDNCNAQTMNEHHGAEPDIVASGPIDPDELHVIVGTCLCLANIVERPSATPMRVVS